MEIVRIGKILCWSVQAFGWEFLHGKAALLNPVGLIIGIMLFTCSRGLIFFDSALTAADIVLLVSCFYFGEP